MRTVILQEWISLDGFAADKDGTTKFFEDPKYNEGFNDYQLELFERVDATILGAVTYRMFSAFWPTADAEQEPVAPKLNALPKIVFSKTINDASWGPVTVRRDDVAHAVRELREQDGKDIVMWGSLSLAKRLIEQNLIDEYWIVVVPIFLGSGKKFIPRDKEMQLELFESKTSPAGAVFLKYRPKITE
jgi:dihydrofolate reductase